jgi:hypothetical protein
MLQSGDREMVALAEAEQEELKQRLATLEHDLALAAVAERTPQTNAVLSLRCVPAPGAMKLRCLPVTCSGCISATPRSTAGRLR